VLLNKVSLCNLPAEVFSNYLVTQALICHYVEFAFCRRLPARFLLVLVGIYERRDEVRWQACNVFACPTNSRRYFELTTTRLAMCLLLFSLGSIATVVSVHFYRWCLVLEHFRRRYTLSALAIGWSWFQFALFVYVNVFIVVISVFALMMLFIGLKSQKEQFAHHNCTLARLCSDYVGVARTTRRATRPTAGGRHGSRAVLSVRWKAWCRVRRHCMRVFFVLNRFLGAMFSLSLVLICCRSAHEVLFILTTHVVPFRVAFTFVLLFECSVIRQAVVFMPSATGLSCFPPHRGAINAARGTMG